MFLLGCGENLWRRFLPKYLQALGAPITAIGAFGTAEDFLDGVYQYPGGFVADRYGRRFALTLFISLAAIGYAVYWVLPSWQFAFLGLALVMALTSAASPTLFAVVGDALPKEKRTMGFTVQFFAAYQSSSRRRSADSPLRRSVFAPVCASDSGSRSSQRSSR